jgi:hypothetical protein
VKLPSPKEQRDRIRRVTPPERRPPNLVQAPITETLPQVRGDLPQNLGGDSRQVLAASKSEEEESQAHPKQTTQDASPRRIWDWARVGTGRLGLIGKLPRAEENLPAIGGMTSKAATTAVTGALDGGRLLGTMDDFCVPSSTSTDPQVGVLVQTEVLPLREAVIVEHDSGFEGFEVMNGIHDLGLFSQTKGSSDDLVASMNETPTPSPRLPSRNGMNTPPPKMKDLNGVSGSETPSSLNTPYTPSPLSTNTNQHTGASEAEAESRSGTSTPMTSIPVTPSPVPPKLEVRSSGSETTTNSRRVPTYKIALTSSLLSPARTVIS